MGNYLGKLRRNSPLILLVAPSLFVYSYMCYLQQTRHHQEPLSTPFDGQDEGVQ
jgi:hypothetical protein